VKYIEAQCRGFYDAGEEFPKRKVVEKFKGLREYAKTADKGRPWVEPEKYVRYKRNEMEGQPVCWKYPSCLEKEPDKTEKPRNGSKKNKKKSANLKKADTGLTPDDTETKETGEKADDVEAEDEVTAKDGGDGNGVLENNGDGNGDEEFMDALAVIEEAGESDEAEVVAEIIEPGQEAEESSEQGGEKGEPEVMAEKVVDQAEEHGAENEGGSAQEVEKADAQAEEQEPEREGSCTPIRAGRDTDYFETPEKPCEHPRKHDWHECYDGSYVTSGVLQGGKRCIGLRDGTVCNRLFCAKVLDDKKHISDTEFHPRRVCPAWGCNHCRQGMCHPCKAGYEETIRPSPAKQKQRPSRFKD
jgi:hypothetical protein